MIGHKFKISIFKLMFIHKYFHIRIITHYNFLKKNKEYNVY